ncbi:hypothetical protein LZF95_17935 [Algoriphagus sp. AGSA1]|uniref:hypothetical protein n=1 Tax=Algoriphagus sp. AGSA1 TaxID=2907213 RepID=UPI001F2624BA|nr:hypothetical protein [Algoriphagus sp. AGSA1]MCE7056569.1 hypothetical protein [Algoriphagus sp. AGSA1]
MTEVKGVIQNANASIKTVTEKSRGTKSQKSELIFYLFEKDQKFTLVKNIGNEYKDEEYQRILKDLKKADSVSVWVKKSETNLYQPKIFQIDADNKTTLQFERVRTENGGLFLLLFFMGLSSLILYFSRLYPSEFKKLFRYTSQED